MHYVNMQTSNKHPYSYIMAINMFFFAFCKAQLMHALDVQLFLLLQKANFSDYNIYKPSTLGHSLFLIWSLVGNLQGY